MTSEKSMQAYDYGMLRDHMGFLSADRKSFDTGKLLNYLLPANDSPTDVARQLGTSRSTLYTSEIKLSKEDISQRLIPFVVAVDLAIDLFQDQKEAQAWILHPNVHFFGKAPYQIAFAGEGRLLIEQLLKWLGKKSGQAY